MKLTIILITALMLLTGSPANAGLLDRVGAECFECGACSLCDILSIFFQVGKYIFAFMAGIALIFVIAAGLMMILSMGNAEQLANGKKLLFHTLIGIAIIMISWSLVNILIMVLSDNKPTDLFAEGKWWQGPKCELLSCAIPTSPGAPGSSEPTGPGSSEEDGCGGLPTDGISTDQCGQASSALTIFLKCLNDTLAEDEALPNPRYSAISDQGGIIITSISDDDVAANGFAYCQNDYPVNSCSIKGSQPCCDHMQNSCHYGGVSRQLESYAADFRSSNYDATARTAFERLITECGESPYYEITHYHVSVGSCWGNI